MPQVKCRRLICEVTPEMGEDVKKRAKEFEITVRDYILEAIKHRMWLEDTNRLIVKSKEQVRNDHWRIKMIRDWGFGKVLLICMFFPPVAPFIFFIWVFGIETQPNRSSMVVRTDP